MALISTRTKYLVTALYSIAHGVISVTDVHSSVLVFWMIVNISVHGVSVVESVKYLWKQRRVEDKATVVLTPAPVAS